MTQKCKFDTNIERRKSAVVNIGGVTVGGGAPIAVQSMANTKTADYEATLAQIAELKNAGCDIVRVAVPDDKSLDGLKKICHSSSLPVVADIHFDYRLAVAAIEAGVAKVRINPGNIASGKLETIVSAAKAAGCAIRAGVNSGSINKEFLQKYGSHTQAMCESLLEYVHVFEHLGFERLVLSVKSSYVRETINTNRYIAAKCHYPLHVGLTEAGVSEIGIVKNSIAIGSLLEGGIGDTIRISLTAPPVDEVRAARRILSALGLAGGVRFVSCPKCGRCDFDLEGFAAEVYDYVKDLKKDVKIAVMGCEVNGPGECADADLGLAGGDKKIAFFRGGKVFRVVDEADALAQFKAEIDKL